MNTKIINKRQSVSQQSHYYTIIASVPDENCVRYLYLVKIFGKLAWLLLENVSHEIIHFNDERKSG